MTLTADGCQEVAVLPDTGCCPPPLCGNDLCCTFVNFFAQLPSGPLWDYWKQAAISYFQRNEDPRQCPIVTNPACPSMVLHAIYVVLKLKKMVSDALWPALREADPMTAVTTLDHWLERLKWEDCFMQACRSHLLGVITPYEVWSECGPVFCDPHFSKEYSEALKHNIVRALTRANMGGIKNLCWLNWVIEPLAAKIEPVMPYVPTPPPTLGNPCGHCPDGAQFTIVPSQDWMEGAGTGDLCEPHPKPRVPAAWDRACDSPAGLPAQIWAGVLAAHCIIRSLLPMGCRGNVSFYCEVRVDPGRGGWGGTDGEGGSGVPPGGGDPGWSGDGIIDVP